MAKNYYSDYVAHITRFYLGCDPTMGFRSGIDKENYYAVAEVFEKLDNDTKIMLSDFYAKNSPKERKVGTYRPTITDKHVHETIISYEKRVARVRGLIC